LKEIKPKEGREQAVPDGDVEIFYPPQGAFQIIQCDESVTEFETEKGLCGIDLQNKNEAPNA
jgi:hypothetical protein